MYQDRPEQPSAMTDIVNRAASEAGSCAAGLAALELLGKFIATTITPDEAARLRERVADIDNRMGKGRSVAQLAIAVDGLRKEVDDLNQLVESVDSIERELSGLVNRPPLDWKADLYRRLTSRVLWVTFIIPVIGIVGTALAGGMSAIDAMNRILAAAAAFGVVEGARDVAARLKGHEVAPAPAMTPSHVE